MPHFRDALCRFLPLKGEAERRGRDLNPRRTFQHVRDFQSRSLGHSDTSPCCEAEKEGFEPSMETFIPITP
jgi:hypothetical protein